MLRSAPALLLLAGCGRGADQPQDVNGLDRELTDAPAARRSPAVTEALHDRIRVDPTVAQRAQSGPAKRPRRHPGGAPAFGGSRCAEVVHYAAGWANRLPADLPLYPGARVTEAAGSDGSRCRLRAVSFATSAAPAKVVDWYRARAGAAGYAPEHRREGATEVLGGTRGDDAFVTYVAPRSGGGADVDLVSNAGR